MMRIGLDVGSTTLKCVVLNEQNEVLFKKYERHLSRIVEKSVEMLCEVAEQFPKEKVLLSISGSAGMGLAERSDIQFVQEVYATRIAVNRLVPGTDAVIELGGEDAKILFLTDGNNASGLEVRMNGSCAGGTGAFIDQMATLLNITPDALNTLSKEHEKIYTIASRCGVFAKSDIQPLLNQGAQKKDVAASILYAVVNQTVAGLAQGREIAGKVVYLGGPMTFLSELRVAFDKTLGITGICPENSLYFVALGAAHQPSEPVLLGECLEAIDVQQFNDDMNALLAGKSVHLPVFDFVSGKRMYSEKETKLGKEDILVIEGIHCLNDQLSFALPKENKFKIYVSALTQLNVDEHNRVPTTDGRLLRRIVRDARTRGTTAKATISMWPSVRRGEESYIFPYQEQADVMFNSALIYELAVLKMYAEPLLFGIGREEPEYQEAKRLLKFLDYFVGIPSESVPMNSILREFIGGGCFQI